MRAQGAGQVPTTMLPFAGTISPPMIRPSDETANERHKNTRRKELRQGQGKHIELRSNKTRAVYMSSYGVNDDPSDAKRTETDGPTKTRQHNRGKKGKQQRVTQLLYNTR